jgi:hypothetical protein
MIAAALLLTLPVSACSTWTSMDVLPEPMPSRVRVELVSGERVDVSEPRMEADTLVGVRRDESDEVRIPMGQVVRLERWENTGAVAVVGFAAFAGLLVLIASIMDEGIGRGGG